MNRITGIKTLLKEEFKDNITFKKTEYQSVLITVLDHSRIRQPCWQMTLRHISTPLFFEMQMVRAKKRFEIVEEIQGKQGTLHPSKIHLLCCVAWEFRIMTNARQYSKVLASGQSAGKSFWKK